MCCFILCDYGVDVHKKRFVYAWRVDGVFLPSAYLSYMYYMI